MGHSLSPLSVLPSARERFLADLFEELRTLDEQGLLRRLTALEAVEGPVVRIDGRRLVCWCSNDYLGLSTHPSLLAAASAAAAEWGIGSRASRLLAGTTRWHTALEESLAAWFGAEAAMVYPSGYLANLGTLGALLSPEDAVFVDRLAHASLLDAARASRAAFRVFRHNDASHLNRLLSRAGNVRRRLIVTEGVFSMDGDRSPLAALVDLAAAHDALIYLDDAHGVFVLGETGCGSPEAAGLSHEHFLYMGTLSKALGAQGGFVIGPKELIDFLRNRARTFIYSTALAVPIAAAATAALQVLRDEPQRRRQLWERARRLHARLALLHRSAEATLPSHILPVIVGQTPRAVELSQRLWEQGIWAPAIRPPTVPEGSARIRLSMTSLHTDAHVDALVNALQEALPSLAK